MNTINKWMFAKSLAGHDKESLYVITSYKDGFVYLADGKTRTLDNLKKKKLKHVQIDFHTSDLLGTMEAAGNVIRDEHIRKALKLKRKELD